MESWEEVRQYLPPELSPPEAINCNVSTLNAHIKFPYVIDLIKMYYTISLDSNHFVMKQFGKHADVLEDYIDHINMNNTDCCYYNIIQSKSSTSSNAKLKKKKKKKNNTKNRPENTALRMSSYFTVKNDSITADEISRKIIDGLLPTGSFSSSMHVLALEYLPQCKRGSTIRIELSHELGITDGMNISIYGAISTREVYYALYLFNSQLPNWNKGGELWKVRDFIPSLSTNGTVTFELGKETFSLENIHRITDDRYLKMVSMSSKDKFVRCNYFGSGGDEVQITFHSNGSCTISYENSLNTVYEAINYIYSRIKQEYLNLERFDYTDYQQMTLADIRNVISKRLYHSYYEYKLKYYQ